MTRERQLLESELLVVRWKRGDRAAFEPIVELWEKPLLYYLRQLVSSEADALEVLQETWLRIFRSLHSLRDPRALPAFLYRTARNVALTRLKQPDLQELDAKESADLRDDRQNDCFSDFHNAEQVHHALARLPLAQREILTLFFLKDLSLEEMSALLRVPVGTVKSRLHYAKRAIKEILTQGENHA